ncbi:hypothetical protein [Roseateles sp.]|uniref:hypothetical protein n=1 Tax=Roseateles sp. TaxID=1971397 RepID=UPI003D0D1825
MSGDFGIGQSVRASTKALQFAGSVQAEKQLRRPTVLAYICCQQRQALASKVEYVVGLIHGIEVWYPHYFSSSNAIFMSSPPCLSCSVEEHSKSRLNDVP